ncbi:hypothetical protein MXC99_07235 [Thauera aromatica]|uniref:hypothetical protein n=1 Tax=Thauera aromatica TaxID=59405 RepID=UPI001FFD726E|nr:hypothetical protein [Thauera aromatica]MCK2087970.1 hypothetical protein [Thauera aromatica]
MPKGDVNQRVVHFVQCSLQPLGQVLVKWGGILASITRRGNGWRVRITRLGHEPLSKTFKAKADAERFAASVEGDIAKGTYRRNPGAKVTLGELLQRYGEEVTPHKRGASVERYRIANLQTRDNPAHKLMVKFAGDITAADVAAWRDKRAKSCSPSTIQKEFALLAPVQY